MLDHGLAPRVALYRAFIEVLNASAPHRNGNAADSGDPPRHSALRAAERKLQTLAPRARQAFLLVAVEEFAPAEAARAMGVTTAELQALVDEAGRDIARQVATDVVIIEDEPLIALDLAEVVSSLGHRVVRVARTAEQAVEATRTLKPGLVLADIHLADGSSGLDAVNEILTSIDVPVIFITAYPERLLTGDRPEPAFLITKPFQPEAVKAAISQALFFDRRAGRKAA